MATIEPHIKGMADGQKVVFRIDNMDCPTEERLIRDKLANVPGIRDLAFNLVQRTLTVTHELPSPAPIESALTAIGMKASRTDKPSAAPTPAKLSWLPLLFSGVAALAAELIHWHASGLHWAVIVLALLSIIIGGLPTYRKGWIALKSGNLNMNALMSLAVTGAMFIGEWPEAAMVMFLFALAEVIEALSLERARNAIRGLMDLAPSTATVRQVDGTWAEIEAGIVLLDAIVRVRPGERIALDGEIVSGQSAVNQSPITGESLPIEKDVGDPVFAGTINETGSFEYRVTAAANDSTLARIIHAVEAAQGSRAPTQRFVDKFARIYTPAVFAVAVAAAVMPPLFWATPWLAAIYRALVLLVIACPCALVISTPVSIVSGLAAAARKGILVKGGAYLEEGRKLNTLALDKTGTITQGKPSETDFVPLTEDAEATRRYAASLAARSDHPVSQAIARAAGKARIPLAEVSDFSAIPGRGVRGTIGGEIFHLGNYRLIKEMGLSSLELDQHLDALERGGKTVVILTSAGQVLALFAVADTVRDTSREAIAALHRLGIETLMLTGDNQHTAEAIARQVGIGQVRGNLLPEDKLRIIESVSRSGRVVGMVGDGINDAPALAKADIGFAMGAAGSDTAIETADVALMDDDLRKIPEFIRLARATGSTLFQNIAISLGIKAVFITLTFLGHATMWMAVFADMGASLLVTFNGLRLLRR